MPSENHNEKETQTLSQETRLTRYIVADPPKHELELRALAVANDAEEYGKQRHKAIDALDRENAAFLRSCEKQFEKIERKRLRYEAKRQRCLARLEENNHKYNEQRQRSEENLAMDAAVYDDWQRIMNERLGAELEARRHADESAAAEDAAAEERLRQRRLTAQRMRELDIQTRAADREKRAAAKLEKSQKQRAAKLAARHAERVRLREEEEYAGSFGLFFLDIYKYIYIFGADIMRLLRSTWRRTKRALRRWQTEIGAKLKKSFGFLIARGNRDMTVIMRPYRTIGRETVRLADELSLRTRLGAEYRKTAPGVLALFKEYFSDISISMNHVVTTFLPLIGIGIFAFTVNYFSTLQFALQVDYCGQNIGYVAAEDDFYEAQNAMLDRLINEEYIAPEDTVPAFQLALVNKSRLIDREELSDKLVTASGNDIASAEGIYIEDTFIGAIENGDEFLVYLDGILDGYRTGEENEVVQFVKTISVRSGIYPSSSVMPLFRLKNEINSSATGEAQTYTVKDGDTLYSIAVEYDTTISALRELNNMSESDTIRGGQKLVVSADGVSSGLGIQVTRRETYKEDIPFSITYVDNDRYPAGYTETISNGIPGTQWVTADITYIDGEAINIVKLSTVPISDPTAKRMLRGTMPVYTAGKDNVDGFIWPVADGTGNFNGSLGSYSGHTGMDIGVPIGKEVVASRGGYVQYATGQSIWPYGRQVYIVHPDGTATRYAHLSAVTVKTGQSVSQGTVIGKSGNSGNSTGPHLHFEIWVGNRYMAPEKYIGYHG